MDEGKFSFPTVRSRSINGPKYSEAFELGGGSTFVWLRPSVASLGKYTFSVALGDVRYYLHHNGACDDFAVGGVESGRHAQLGSAGMANVDSATLSSSKACCCSEPRGMGRFLVLCEAVRSLRRIFVRGATIMQ